MDYEKIFDDTIDMLNKDMHELESNIHAMNIHYRVLQSVKQRMLGFTKDENGNACANISNSND